MSVTADAAVKKWAPENLEALMSRTAAALEAVDGLTFAPLEIEQLDLSAPERWLVLGAVNDALLDAGAMVAQLVRVRVHLNGGSTDDDERLLNGVGHGWWLEYAAPIPGGRREMPSGACVIPYHGKRGLVWKIKYRDADGRQIKETLGRADAGWTEVKAQRELGKRLDQVERGMKKPARRTFGDLIDEFERVELAARPRKKSTLTEYRVTLNNHFRPWFGDRDLVQLSRSPQEFEEYAAEKLKRLRPKTVRNHLMLANLMFKKARRWRWVSENPLELVDPPEADDVEAETLAPAEVTRLLAAYEELAGREPANGWWYRVARRMTVVALSTALRRGELLGLRWQDVSLLEGQLEVRQSFVLGEMTTPKSRAGRRTIPLGDRAAAALEEQFRASRFRPAESLVFCHAQLGTPLDPTKLTSFVRKGSQDRRYTKPFRPWHGLRHTALTETAAAGPPGDVRSGKGRTRAGRERSGTCTLAGQPSRTPQPSPNRGSSRRPR